MDVHDRARFEEELSPLAPAGHVHADMPLGFRIHVRLLLLREFELRQEWLQAQARQCRFEHLPLARSGGAARNSPRAAADEPAQRQSETPQHALRIDGGYDRRQLSYMLAAEADRASAALARRR